MTTISHTDVGVRYPKPEWVTSGSISSLDATFLTAFIEAIAPPSMVELGVCSGYSSAILLHALSRVRRAASASEPWLFSYDIEEVCYFDHSRKIGSAVDELAPEHKAHWRLELGDALAVRKALAGKGFTFAFIDAYHRHPWPTLDLLGLLPTLRLGSWVALHDVRLPQLAQVPEHREWGAQHLFDAWPWAKQLEPVQGNTGMIRLDGSAAEIHAVCNRVLDLRWEAPVSRAMLTAIGVESFGSRQNDARSPADRSIAALRAAVAASRPLIIWSAGQAGREMLSLLRQVGCPATAFVDRDPRKQGQLVDGLDVRDPRTLDDAGPVRPFVAVCGIFGQEISDSLETRGYINETDYVIV